MEEPRADRWHALARGPVQAGLARARERFGELGVQQAELERAAVSRTLARFERGGRAPDEPAFRGALERAALDELALALAWQRGDEFAWSAYARELREPVLEAALRQGAARAAAEVFADELPGALLAARSEGVASPLERYDGSGSLRAWLCTIARRRVVDAAKRAARQVELDEFQLETRAPDPAAAAEGSEAVQRMQRAALELRDVLTPRERIALLLKHEQGLAQRAIAARLGVSDSRVTRLVQHATQKVRERLGRELEGALPGEGTLPDALLRALGSSDTSGQIRADPRDLPMTEESP